jgi:DNA-binding LacI/PurR family transcriptional regulator
VHLFVDKDSSLPPFLQIKNRLKDAIQDGEFSENGQVPSVREVARMAGVSLATIQRAFNELKQEKIIYARVGHGYFVNLKNVAFSNTVHVFLPSQGLKLYTDIVNGMYAAAHRYDFNIKINSLNTDKLLWNEQTINLLSDARREKAGVVFIEEAFGDVLEKCRETAKSVPFVTIEWVMENAISLINDYEASAFKATEYLIRERHASSLLVLKGRESQYNAREKLKGIVAAAQKHGLTSVDYLNTEFDAFSAYHAVKKYLKLKRPDAIFCANDYEAMGTLGALVEKGIQIGRDVALMGYGNFIDKATSYFPLTTVDQNWHQFGVKAADVLFSIMQGRPVEPIIEVKTRLLVQKT